MGRLYVNNKRLAKTKRGKKKHKTKHKKKEAKQNGKASARKPKQRRMIDLTGRSDTARHERDTTRSDGYRRYIAAINDRPE